MTELLSLIKYDVWADHNGRRLRSLFPKTSLKQRLNPKDKGVIYMSDYEIFAILLRVIELVLIANLYKSTKK